jgi:hypothetical protein
MAIRACNGCGQEDPVWYARGLCRRCYDAARRGSVLDSDSASEAAREGEGGLGEILLLLVLSVVVVEGCRAALRYSTP